MAGERAREFAGAVDVVSASGSEIEFSRYMTPRIVTNPD
jgi:hypothetical protein